MNCPECGYYRTIVIDCRDLKKDQTIRRRRECKKCGFRFTTYERVPDDESLSEKRARQMLNKIKNIIDDLKQ